MLKEDNFFNKQFHKSELVITDNIYDSNDSASSYKIEWFLDKKVTNVRSKIIELQIRIKYMIQYRESSINF